MVSYCQRKLAIEADVLNEAQDAGCSIEGFMI